MNKESFTPAVVSKGLHVDMCRNAVCQTCRYYFIYSTHDDQICDTCVVKTGEVKIHEN